MTKRRQLNVADDFALPLSAQTSTIVVYGGKGMGKTNFAAVFVEECHSARLRFSVIDPLDVWWGLQHGAKRGTPGLDVVILGGARGDLPIDPLAGSVVADFVVDEDVSTVIVLRHASGKMWTKGQKIRFVTDYTMRLYERQGEQRRPLVQIIDEAGRFVPQIASRGDIEIAKCIGAIEELVECGRNVAVGVMLITQRSARMAKSVSELADCMVAFRTVGPRSVDAIVDWFGEHVPRERQKQLIAELRRLDIGTALVVSPGWLDFEGVAHVRHRQTFDSSATPQPGKSLRPPGPPRKPDLALYKARMAETIERANEEDPRALKARIVELERALKKAESSKKTVRVPVQTVKHVIPPEIKEQIETHAASVKIHVDELRKKLKSIGADADRIFSLARKQPAVVKQKPNELGPVIPPSAGACDAEPTPKKKAVSKPNGAGSADGHIGGGLRRMMIALAQRPQGLTQKQLGMRAGMSSRSGTFSTYLSRMRSHGWIDGSQHVVITDAGLDALGDFEPLPTGRALFEYWRGKLGGGARRLFVAAYEAYPASLSHNELAERAELSARSGTFSTYLSRLRTLELIHGRQEISASEEFFS